MRPKSSGESAQEGVRSSRHVSFALDAREYEALAAFRHALRHFLSFSESAAAKMGLAAQQYQALLAIKGCPGRDVVTINELASLLLIKHNSAVGLVDRLESEGLVKRSIAPEDRRKVNVRLTRKGERIFERLAAVHRDELRRIGPRLGDFLRYFSERAGDSAPPPAR
jgi:DNA-binding MarR family transcriptional regulator